MIALSRENDPEQDTYLSSADRQQIATFSDTRRINEFKRSRALIRELVQQGRPELEPSDIHIRKEENGRPYITIRDERLFAGIAHSGQAILVAVSPQQIGIDLEPVGRKANDRLRKRILHEQERNPLKSVETIRLWTMKEAVLKLRGTGLRFAMNRFQMKCKDDHRYETEIENESIMIHSHQIDNFWVAVAIHY
jgi:phosphopantetheinyl transferase